MSASREPITRMLLEQVFGCSEEGILARDSVVLSCGGIYIPRRERRDPLSYQILTTANNNESVKLVIGARPRNALHDMMLKESMN